MLLHVIPDRYNLFFCQNDAFCHGAICAKDIPCALQVEESIPLQADNPLTTD